MEPDQRVIEMRDQLYGAIAELVVSKYLYFCRKYRVVPHSPSGKEPKVDFPLRFNVALRHAFRKIEEERGEKPKGPFLHLFCGRKFPTEEELNKHLQHRCVASKRNQKAFAAQERLLQRKKAHDA